MIFGCQFRDNKYDKWLSRIELKIDGIVRGVNAVALAVDKLQVQGKNTMAIMDDLRSALADLAQAVNDSAAEMMALLTKIATVNAADQTPDADVAAAVQQLRTLINGLNESVASAKAAANPPAPAPAPAPTPTPEPAPSPPTG